MDLGMPAGEVVLLVCGLMAGGLIAGVLSGLFGVGGGGILVPVLYELFGAMGAAEDIRLHLAVGTSFAVIIPTAFRAARSHYLRGSIDGDVLRMIAPAALLGVILGALTAKYSDDDVMKLVWVGSASVLSISLLLRRAHWRIPGEISNPAIALPVGTVVGYLATIMGVGGGAYITPVMTLLGRPIHQAVGTSAGFGVIIAIPALIGYVWAGWGAEGLPVGSVGYVSLIGAAAMIPTGVLAAPYGVRLAHGLPRRALEIAFAAFLSLVGLRFLIALIY
ncbi:MULTISPECIES: sulfite exporter TauE/SafE family protein [Rhodomicrobium]|uniref:sulfite exporter TauE/SafE family protein n=1 Tax=Rhodomicrobium TaxID=1068 RepID=UPI000B4A9812|nr:MULTISPECIES: sulfite exporter TauE/SafE family protein [Rhodomicrobium]